MKKVAYPLFLTLPKVIKEIKVARVWLLLCVSVLVFGWIQRDIHDMPEAFSYFMIALTFPAGFLAALSGSFISQAFNTPYSPFWDLVPFWFLATVLGYMQWFIILPWLYKKVLD